jgi:hypothetical protein
VISPPTQGPIVGYRCWVADRGRLRSATSNEYWPGGILEARCGEKEPHAAPEITCRCGIYVCDSHQTALRYQRQRYRWRPWLRTEEVVVGAVQLWGGPGRPVIVGELKPDRTGRTGLQYRAPYARIVALAKSPHAEQAARTLGVPVVAAEYLEAYAREVGGGQLRPPLEGGAEKAPAAGPARGVVAVLADRSAATLRRELGPLSWQLLCTAARGTWWLLWRLARVTWWISWRIAWLAVLALVAVVGQVLEQTAPRRSR